jgi:CDP-glycerol glycerophosphotransferase (TagB/SpsB family)
MTKGSKTQILFTGYAPVHFICFQPLFDCLSRLPGVEVYVSGGLRTGTEGNYLYDERKMYGPFGLPPERILTVREMRGRDFDVLFAANTKLIKPRNVSTCIQLFHGISFRNKAVRPENMGCDYFFTVGPYMQRKFAQAGLLQPGDRRAVPIGFPKTDRLLNGELNRQDLLRRYGFDGSRPVVLYAPTGQQYNSLETMGEEVIERLNQSGRYDILIKLHDHPRTAGVDWPARLRLMETGHCRLARELDVVPLLHAADLLITDASSVSSEFSLLDRPMVFLDVPQLLEFVRQTGSLVDLDTWGRKGGVIVERAKDVVAAVDAGLADPARHSDIRQAMAKDLFFHPGTATRAAVAWLQAQVIGRPPAKQPANAA